MPTNEDDLIRLEFDLLENPPPAEDVDRLRFALQQMPENLVTRIQLHAYLIHDPVRNRSELLANIEFFIRHAPYLGFTDSGELVIIGDKDHSRLRNAWTDAIGAIGLLGSYRTLVRAIYFYREWDRTETARLIQMALALRSESWNIYYLAGQFVLAGIELEEPECTAVQALHHLDAAFKLAKPPYNRFEGRIAVAALGTGDTDRARTLAETALENRGFNVGSNVSLGHVVLGTIDALSGNLTTAKAHLEQSIVRDCGSNGPYLLLARELLMRDCKQAVVDYLRRVKEIWPLGRQRCIRWIQLIQDGETPKLTNDRW